MATLSVSQLKSLAQQVGLGAAAASVAAAIALAESGGVVNAQNPSSGAAGLWQILPSAHPQYNVQRLLTDPLYNAQAMAAISNRGTNWQPWETYTNGAYLKFLSGANALASAVGSALGNIKTGRSNGFPLGQCTWWADERYHELTGYYIPWNGNAYQWETGARASGWNVSSTPPKGIPSIIIMQPRVQGAAALGHVAAVEKVNNNGTVTISSMNWHDGPVLRTVQGYPVTQQSINVGTGVSFAWAIGTGTSSTGLLNFVTSVAQRVSLAPNASVTTALATLDDNLALKNPFDTDTSEPLTWLGEVGTNTINDMGALLFRGICIMVALFLLYSVVKNFVDFKGVASNAGELAAKFSPLIG